MTPDKHNNVVNFGSAIAPEQGSAAPARRAVCINLPGLRYARLGTFSLLTIGPLQRLRVGTSVIWSWGSK